MTTILRKSLPTFQVCDYDVLVHGLYRSVEIQQQLLLEFDTCIRSDISRIVHSTPERMRALLDIMRPPLRMEMEAFSGADVIFDIPLYFEMRRDHEYVPDVDCIICVTAPLSARLERIRARDMLTDERIQRIMSNQIPCDVKQQMSDYVVHNNGTIDELVSNVSAVMSSIGVIA